MSDNIQNETDEDKPAFPNAIDITPVEDGVVGGLLKEIKREGTGKDSPLAGDEVFVHYVGTLLNGDKFDSSRDRNQQFKFTLGKGKVIKGWDIGVATMKKGEICYLICKPEYAYGKMGAGAKIPPDATLIFEVELFEWKGEDISPEKDEGILRNKIRESLAYETPNDGALCKIQIKGWTDAGTFQDKQVSYTCGEGFEQGLVDGVEIAVKQMHKDDKIRLAVKPKYGYGKDGNKVLKIPGGTTLVYEITMLEFEKTKDIWEMEFEEKLEQANLIKSKGTDYFKKKDFVTARKFYKRITDLLKDELNANDSEKQKRKDLLIAAYSNIAQCWLNIGDNIEAKHSCDSVLELDEKNEKARFRRGTALMKMKDYEEASKEFQKVLDVNPKNDRAKKKKVPTATLR